LEYIDKQHNKSSIEDKRKIIGLMFPNNLVFENKKNRTTDINPILKKIANVNKALPREKKNGTRS